MTVKQIPGALRALIPLLLLIGSSGAQNTKKYESLRHGFRLQVPSFLAVAPIEPLEEQILVKFQGQREGTFDGKTDELELAKSYSKTAVDAAAVLVNRAGDCTEHALLFVALARTAGVPAREVSGLTPAGCEPGWFCGHAWTEYHDGERWVEVDPTLGQRQLDALHLRLAADGDLSWMAILGELQLSLVEVR